LLETDEYRELFCGGELSGLAAASKFRMKLKARD
jgi:hypothetical protein